MSNPNTIMNYKLNPTGAKQVGIPMTIEERGAYMGLFTRAELVTSPKGTQGIEFDFKSDDGRTAKFLTIWTVNGDGKELYGRKVIDAILTSAGVREISAKRGVVKKWDTNAHAEISVETTIFPELMGPRIGLVLAREEYVANDKSRKWKNMIVSPYEAATGKLPIERLENKPAELLDKMLPLLRDKPLKAPAQQAGRMQDDGGFDGMPPSSDDDFNF